MTLFLRQRHHELSATSLISIFRLPSTMIRYVAKNVVNFFTKQDQVKNERKFVTLQTYRCIRGMLACLLSHFVYNIKMKV